MRAPPPCSSQRSRNEHPPEIPTPKGSRCGRGLQRQSSRSPAAGCGTVAGTDVKNGQP
jgi:hypothetical protein